MISYEHDKEVTFNVHFEHVHIGMIQRHHDLVKHSTPHVESDQAIGNYLYGGYM